TSSIRRARHRIRQSRPGSELPKDTQPPCRGRKYAQLKSSSPAGTGARWARRPDRNRNTQGWQSTAGNRRAPGDASVVSESISSSVKLSGDKLLRISSTYFSSQFRLYFSEVG